MSTIHIVCGPTASGKSAEALALAGTLDGVIINCDSQQLYNGLPILTAQPSDEDKVLAPHELYAALDPNHVCSAGHWRELAQPIIETVLERGQTPIICGGTGLYIRALMDGLSPMPDIPDEVRQQAIDLHAALGTPAFHAKLKDRDPVMAARLDPNNKARLIRAWEVLEATGRSLAEWQKAPPIGPPAHWRFEIHKIMPEREVLYQRCNDRFLQMMEMGAVEEVKDFNRQIERGDVKPGTPLTKALGLKPLQAFVNGDIAEEEAITLAQAETRQYAKRQVTWFRNQL